MSTPCWNLAVYLIPRSYYFRCNHEIFFLGVMTGSHQALLYSEINCQKIGAGTSLDGNERDMRVKSKMATKTLKISPEFHQIRINWHRSRKKYPLVRRTTNFGKLLVRRHFLLVTDDRTSANSTSV